VNTRDVSDTRERLVPLKRSLSTHKHITKQGMRRAGRKKEESPGRRLRGARSLLA
jgi:hypothetical protein